MSARAPEFTAQAQQGWWLQHWASPRIMAGGTDRHLNQRQLLEGVRSSPVLVEAEQVHGGSLASIGHVRSCAKPIPGCDALLTDVPGMALLIRTADCLPIFFAAPWRGVVGIAHAGWRGLAALLPAKMIAAFRHLYHARPEELHVAIGPAIRSCCYEVGAEFEKRFGRFVQERKGRRTCDLIGVATDQLRQSGVRAQQLFDSGCCTACDLKQWFSVRREGASTGRLTSLIMLHP